MALEKFFRKWDSHLFFNETRAVCFHAIPDPKNAASLFFFPSLNDRDPSPPLADFSLAVVSQPILMIGYIPSFIKPVLRKFLTYPALFRGHCHA